MNYKELANNDLIKHCAVESDNQLVWNEFYRRFDDHIRLMVMRYCGLRRLPGQSLVDDLAQDVYMRLVKEERRVLHHFRGENENAIFTFLALTARTVVSEYEKKKNAIKRRHQEESLDKPVSPAEGGLRLIDILRNPYIPAPDEALILESLQQEVQALLDEAITGHEKERDQKIFLYHVFEGLTPQQISERAALSPKRIRNIITTTRKRLKAKPPRAEKI